MTLDEVERIEKEGGIYCRAYFDADGRVTIFEKYEDGQLSFQDKYYYKGKIIRREMTTSDGKKIFGFINKDGKYIGERID